MKLKNGLHLAYCTNIHRGETWAQTLASLDQHTLAVRDRVSAGQPYAVGLRLSDLAARELQEPAKLNAFKNWLDRNNCYVFTINGFPFGQFHGTRVKEQVYRPDWSSLDRLDYTKRLFDLLAELVPAGVEGSVSTLPGSFKEFGSTPAEILAMHRHLWECVDHLEKLSERRGQLFHLGLEPEPLCLFENAVESVAFFDRLQSARSGQSERLLRHVGLNYDTCHLAIEYEDPAKAVACLRGAGIRISKFHLSSALVVSPTAAAREWLRQFGDDIYLHQVIARLPGGELVRYRDLDIALAAAAKTEPESGTEWRVHFHIPLHCPPTGLAGNTIEHLRGVLDLLASHPDICSHLEMETYTWEVMPAEMKGRSVVDQLVGEYRWCLGELRDRGLAG
jgi:sugar phosphate isomerase/epimerase